MYGFVDTLPQGTNKNTSLSIQTVFNGFNLDDELTDETGSFQTLRVAGRSNASYRLNTIEVAGMDGVHEHSNTTLNERYPSITFKIKDKSNEGLRKRLNRLNSLLEGSKKMLVFTDEDVFYYATLSTLDIPDEDSNDLVGTINFLCSDPYKYGAEKTLFFPSDMVRIVNDGATATKPIFQFEVLAPITFAMIQNQNDEYQMIGSPIDLENETPFVKYQRVLYSNAGSMGGWETALEDEVDGQISGNMEVSNGQFRASNYGTGTGWHGPAIKRRLSESIHDFRMTTWVSFRNGTDAEMVGRVEIYLLDINGNAVGKVAMKDTRNSSALAWGEARAGSEEDNNFLINEGGDRQGAWNNFSGHLRLEREGNRWEAYFAKVDTSTGRHHTRRTATWVDSDGKYSAPVNQVVIHIATVGNHVPVNTGVSSLNIYKINQESNNEVPYIADVGDVITFDHETNELLINGEDRTDLKNFGGQYFNLLKGNNDLVIRPENSFDASVTFKNKFK